MSIRIRINLFKWKAWSLLYDFADNLDSVSDKSLKFVYRNARKSVSKVTHLPVIVANTFFIVSDEDLDELDRLVEE